MKGTLLQGANGLHCTGLLFQMSQNLYFQEHFRDWTNQDSMAARQNKYVYNGCPQKEMLKQRVHPHHKFLEKKIKFQVSNV